MFDIARLRRKESWTADELAEELYAMFGPLNNLSHSGRITINSSMDQAPIVIKRSGTGSGVKLISLLDQNGDEEGSVSI